MEEHPLPRFNIAYVLFLVGNIIAIISIVAFMYLNRVHPQKIHKSLADTLPDTIVVNTNTVLQTMPANFFGVNYVAFWDGSQGDAGSSQALSQTPIKAIRFPGGIPGDWYDWQDPYYKSWSTTSPLDLWNYAQKIGATALFQTNYQGNGLPNPPGQSYTVNSAQNAGAWAAYDKAQGIKADMEVGNEEDINMQSADDPEFQPYIDAFNAQATAMHQADPSVKVFGPVGTNEWYWWALDSLGMFLKQTGNINGTGQVDGVSLHFYTGTGWSDTINAAQQWASGPWNFIQNTIKANDTRALPVYITEWNLGDSDSGTGYNQTLGHGLVIADMIGAFAQSGVAQEDYFALHCSGNYGLLACSGESNPTDTATPAYYATALWGKMGNHVVSLTQSYDPGSTVSAYATKKDDGTVQVMAINKQAQSSPLQISLQGMDPTGGQVRIYTLTGATGSVSDTSINYNGTTDPSDQQMLPSPMIQAVTSSTISYTIPAYSMVVFDISPSNGVTLPVPTIDQSVPTNTYNSTITLSGTKDASESMVMISSYMGTVSYPDSTHWSAQVPLAIGDNTFAISGMDSSNNASASTSITINRHASGNIKGSGVVNLTDLSILAKDWHRGLAYGDSLYNPMSDMNGDGNVDIYDLSELAKYWGQ